MQHGIRAAVAALILATPALAQQGETIQLTGRVAAVWNIAGTVTLEPGSGAAVAVTVLRGGRAGSSLRLERGEVRGADALRVVYPDDHIVYPAMGRGSRSEFGVGDDWTFTDGRGRAFRRMWISGDGSGAEAWADLRVAVPAGRTVQVHLAAGTMSARNVDGTIVLDGMSSDVAVSGGRGDYTVDVGSGRVVATDMRGTLRLDTGSGDVELRRIEADDLSVDTGSGAVRGSELRTPKLTVDTGSGDVALRVVTARTVKVDTGSGNVTVDLAADIDQLSVDTGSGDVTIHAPASLNARVDLESSNGHIETDFAVQARRTARDELHGTIGSGAGAVSVDAGSGDVRLLKR